MSSPVHQRRLQWPALLLGCALFPVASLAQVSFPSHQIAANSSVLDIAGHGDFNNDGREDLMVAKFTQTSTTFTPTYQLYLSSGDGTYQAPKTLPAPVGANFLGIGDFNNDGKLDFASFNNSAVVVYLGNGDGTFQAGKTVTSGATNLTAIVAADLNHDNKTDLITLLNGSNPMLQIWISNGNGTFSKGQTVSVYNPNSSGFLSGAVAGDFDGDGKPDIAVLYSFEGPTSVQVWYGDGAGHLGSPFVIKDPNRYEDAFLVAADVNNDGRSDLISPSFIFGLSGTSQFLPKLAVFSGNSNRTLSYSSLTTSQCPGAVAVADFNGDGRNDLAYSAASCTTSSTSDFVVRPGTGSGGFGAEQTVYQNLYRLYQPYAVRTTTGTKPDIVFTEDTAARTSPATNPPAALVLLSNDSVGSFPGCGVTGVAEGIRICTPGASAASPVTFSIGAAGPTPMRTAAVWVDGKKVFEQLAHAFSNYSFLDASIPLAAGSHAITIYGTGWDDTLQKKSFTLTVGGGSTCTAPTSPGVNVCKPANGSMVSSPVQVLAASTISGTLARMELWVDGVKKYTETSSKTLSTSISLGAGSHRFVVFAVNTAGTKWEGVVSATVK
ncbi:MAG: FG-GAP repeat domain-containing protein [Acidobacteriaceae bacterium]